MPHPERERINSIIQEVLLRFTYQGSVRLYFYPSFQVYTLVAEVPQPNGEEPLGFGVTWNTLEQMDQAVPGLRARLQTEKGKVVFLGNGLSTAAEELLLLPADTEPSADEIELESRTPIILVDLFDYAKLLIDLQGIREGIEKQQVPPPRQLEFMIQQVTRLQALEKTGKVKLVTHRVGSGSVPAELQDAAVVVNLRGPSQETLDEQLKMLGVGGQLYLDCLSEETALPPGSELRRLQGSSAVVVTKNL